MVSWWNLDIINKHDQLIYNWYFVTTQDRVRWWNWCVVNKQNMISWWNSSIRWTWLIDETAGLSINKTHLIGEAGFSSNKQDMVNWWNRFSPKPETEYTVLNVPSKFVSYKIPAFSTTQQYILTTIKTNSLKVRSDNFSSWAYLSLRQFSRWTQINEYCGQE